MLRRDRIVSFLQRIVPEDARVLGKAAVLARWHTDSERLTIACNLGSYPIAAALPNIAPIWGALTGGELPAATTVAWIES